MDFGKAADTISGFIANEVKKRGSKGVIVGLSGGLDSTVAAHLAVRALGPDSVFGLILPESKISSKKDVEDAKETANLLRIKYKVIDISKAKKDLVSHLPKNKLAQSNLAARLRMSILYYFASVQNRLVLGTSDKSELMLGYFTKYGDGAADLLPISGLYKTEVRSLAKHIGIESKLITKKSSPGLQKGQTAEGEIGMLYEDVDSILAAIESNISSNREKLLDKEIIEKVSSESGVNKNKVSKLLSMIKKNRHKLESPPACVIG